MGKICHTIVDDVGDDNVFLGGNKKRKTLRIMKKCVHMAHIHVGVHKGP